MTGKLIGWIILGLVIAGAGVIAFVKRQFIKESYQELLKVTWPTKEHSLNSAIVTILFIVSFSLVLAFIDYLINLIVIGMVK